MSLCSAPNIAPIYRPFIEGRAMGLETDLERTWNGLEAKVERRINGGITAIEPYCSLLHLEKKIFYTTRQLVTHSVVIICASSNYTGDSFRCTRHPLITIVWYILLILSDLQSQFTRHPKNR